jgi:hypothetical protein
MCLISSALCYEDIWVSGGTAPPSETLALDGGGWSVLCPGRYTQGEGASGNHWTGGWVGPEPVWTL